MTASEIFSRWNASCLANPEKWAEVGAKYLWKIEGAGGGVWCLDCAESPGVREGEEKHDFSVTLSTEDFLALASGDLNPQQAFLKGRLKISGDIGLALRLNSLIDQLVES